MGFFDIPIDDLLGVAASNAAGSIAPAFGPAAVGTQYGISQVGNYGEASPHGMWDAINAGSIRNPMTNFFEQYGTAPTTPAERKKKAAEGKKHTNVKHAKTWKTLRGKPVGAQGANRGSGGGGSVDTSLADSVDSGLGEFGSPDLSRVDKIVNSILSDATKQYRWANQDSSQNLKQDMANITGAFQQYTRAANAMQPVGQNLADRQRAYNLGNRALDDALHIKLSREAAQQAQNQAVSNPQYRAANTADYQLQNALTNSAESGFNRMLQFSKLAQREDALAAGRASTAEARKAIADNNRALAEIRAGRERTRMDVEKSLWDQHIAKRLAEAEYGGRGESIKDSQYARAAGDRTAGMQAAEAKLTKQQVDQKNIERAYAVLYGEPQKVKQVTGYTPDGKPIYEDVLVPGQRPSTPAEAVNMLASIGLVGPRWRAIAKRSMEDQIHDLIPGIIGGVQSTFEPRPKKKG